MLFHRGAALFGFLNGSSARAANDTQGAYTCMDYKEE